MCKKKTTEEFIKEAKEVHKHNNYKYEGYTIYVNSDSQIEYYCNVLGKNQQPHGIQKQSANSHIRGIGCPICGRDSSNNSRTRKLADIIEECKKIHKNKYTYNIQGLPERVPGRNKIPIKCNINIHKPFEQSLNKHLIGQGCPQCRYITIGSKKATKLEDYINKSNEAHKYKYKDGYEHIKSLEYIKDDDIIRIICPEHGAFNQNAGYHKYGNGCQICGGSIKKTLEEFIEEANKIHNNKYDYNKSIYQNANIKLIICCHEVDEDGIEHGEFEQTPHHHINREHGCPKCSNCYPYTRETAIEKANKTHENYYTYDDFIYNGTHNKSIITCPIHGNFEQEVKVHLIGCGCPNCGIIKVSNSKTRTTEEFIEYAKIQHGDKYNYDKTIYTKAKDDLTVTCPNHGDFIIKADYHLQGGECLKCNPKKPWSKVSMEWLKYIQQTEAPELEHYENMGREHHIKNSNYKADGYDPIKNSIYEFHGCYWHGCHCKRNLLDEDDITMLEERYNKTLEREKFIREQGYNLIVMWECEWNKKKNSNI